MIRVCCMIDVCASVAFHTLSPAPCELDFLHSGQSWIPRWRGKRARGTAEIIDLCGGGVSLRLRLIGRRNPGPVLC